MDSNILAEYQNLEKKVKEFAIEGNEDFMMPSVMIPIVDFIAKHQLPSEIAGALINVKSITLGNVKVYESAGINSVLRSVFGIILKQISTEAKTRVSGSSQSAMEKLVDLNEKKSTELMEQSNIVYPRAALKDVEVKPEQQNPTQIDEDDAVLAEQINEITISEKHTATELAIVIETDEDSEASECAGFEFGVDHNDDCPYCKIDEDDFEDEFVPAVINAITEIRLELFPNVGTKVVKDIKFIGSESSEERIEKMNSFMSNLHIYAGISGGKFKVTWANQYVLEEQIDPMNVEATIAFVANLFEAERN